MPMKAGSGERDPDMEAEGAAGGSAHEPGVEGGAGGAHEDELETVRAAPAFEAGERVAGEVVPRADGDGGDEGFHWVAARL